MNLRRFVAFALAVLAAPVAAYAQTETVYYFHTDAIGSVRMITDANGQEVARHDFLPFGEEWASTSYSNVPNRLKCAGLERDPGTGLDYALARYYQQQSGRFASPDIPGIDQDLLDPQSWDLYVYVRNNPVRYVDPTGLKCENGYDLAKGVFCTETIGEDRIAEPTRPGKRRNASSSIVCSVSC